MPQWFCRMRNWTAIARSAYANLVTKNSTTGSGGRIPGLSSMVSRLHPLRRFRDDTKSTSPCTSTPQRSRMGLRRKRASMLVSRYTMVRYADVPPSSPLCTSAISTACARCSATNACATEGVKPHPVTDTSRRYGSLPSCGSTHTQALMAGESRRGRSSSGRLQPA